MKHQYKIAWNIFCGLTVFCIFFWGLVLGSQSRAIKAYQQLGKTDDLYAELHRERNLLAKDEDFIANFISTDRKNTGFLTKIGELNQYYAINFIATEPITRQATGKYVKSSRKIVFEADFLEIVRFINNLEQAKGIKVSDLAITPIDKGIHTVELTANTFSLKQEEAGQLLDSAAGAADTVNPAESASDVPQWDVHKSSLLLPLPSTGQRSAFMQRVVLRDPFSASQGQDKIIPVTANNAAELLPMLEADAKLPVYYLTGIIHYPDYSIAIVEGGQDFTKTIRKGDLLEGVFIEDVETDRLILSKGGRSYKITIGEQIF